VVVGSLAQVAEVLPEHGVLHADSAEVMQPRDRCEFEVVVRLQPPEHFDVALVDLVRLDRPMTAGRCVAAAVPACRCFHARRNNPANELCERYTKMADDLA